MKIEIMSGLSNIIRYGITILTDSKYNKQTKEIILESVNKSFQELAEKLESTEIDEVMTHLIKIGKNLETISNNFSELGIRESKRESKNKQEQELSETQILAKHIFKDYEYNLVPNLSIINSAIRVINIAKEEIGKYVEEVCVCNNGDGIVLRKVTDNT